MVHIPKHACCPSSFVAHGSADSSVAKGRKILIMSEVYSSLFFFQTTIFTDFERRAYPYFWHILGSFLFLSGKFLLLIFTKQCEWVSKLSSHIGVYSDWSYEHCGPRSRVIINPHFTQGNTCSGGMKEATEL